MINDFTRLDLKFVEGLTPTEIDDVFIARMFWRSDDDGMTAEDVAYFFVDYPGLDTWEKVFDKSWECIEKMMKQQLVTCTNMRDENISLTEVIAHKNKIYAIMDRDYEPGDQYDFLFIITIKGYEFMKRYLWKYRPIIDELQRLTDEDDD